MMTQEALDLSTKEKKMTSTENGSITNDNNNQGQIAFCTCSAYICCSTVDDAEPCFFEFMSDFGSFCGQPVIGLIAMASCLEL
jgi:hypothetical protein